ncbi:ABC transporter ATP-binding permease protein [Weissella minor]|uniref:ABC transporter ATP-binding permease protein n=1 Tax=Weissella minor TaxID=1620 RepID=A0A0R2JJF9_9LACO|nr:ABC transporter ATP-binding protein [Weissella minor]KRN76022.1 ABC transporter ATP-binding permease protein [Weissella minor]
MIKFLLPYISKYKKDVVWASLTIAIAAATSLWQPKLLQQVIQAIADDELSKMYPLGIQLIVIALIGLAAGALNTVFSARIAMGTAADIRADEYKKIQTFSFGNIERFSTGSLVVRMTNDVQQVQTIVMAFFQSLLRVPILFVGALVLALTTLPQLWWVILVMVILVVLISMGVFQPMGKLFGSVQGWIEKTNNMAKENLQGVRVVKSFNQEKNEEERFDDASTQLTNINIKIGYLFGILMPAFFLIGEIAIAVSILFVGRNITSDPQMLGALTSFVNYLLQIMNAIVMAGFMMTFAARGMESAKRIMEVMDTEPDLTFDAAAPSEALSGDVEFDHVSFAYPGDDAPVLKDVSFKVKQGEMIGIVGATGSGKSTLAQLIPRLYDPTEGSVKVGNEDLRHVNEKSLRNAVAFVLQKAILFSGKISDNLRQGKSNAGRPDMVRAAKMAQASEFIEKYDDDYEHIVEERSSNFSGGQKQRLSITRGVIGEPAVLILDDSTSALDARSEKLVQEALDKQLSDTTKFVIAEKISSVINADRIFVMEDGELIATGKHHELVENSPAYREIYETQKAQEVID